MAHFVPVVISFVARILGLGGISDTIRNIINRIRQLIDRALDRVVEWIVTQARRLGSAIMRGARSVAGRVMNWLGIRKEFTTADGHRHTLFFQASDRSARLMMASNGPAGLSQRIQTAYGAQRPAQGSPEARLFTEAAGLLGEIDRMTAQQIATSTAASGSPQTTAISAQIGQKLDALSDKLRGLN